MMAKSNKDNNELSFKFNEKCDNACVKKDTLIIYSSLSGNTAKIALVAAKTLGARYYEIGEFCDKFKINLDENLESIAPNLEQNSAQNLADAKRAQNHAFKSSSYENLTQKSDTHTNFSRENSANQICKNGAHENNLQNLAQNTQILDQSAYDFALNRGEILALNITNTERKNFLQEKSMQEKSSQDSKSHNLANKNLTDENYTPNLEQNLKQNLAQNRKI